MKLRAADLMMDEKKTGTDREGDYTVIWKFAFYWMDPMYNKILNRGVINV